MPSTSSTSAINRLRIGCAGWSIGREHGAQFLDGPSVLARYATRFNAVEINSSFYRPHQQKTYARWAATVPEDFQFSVKLPKEVTHVARLVKTAALLDAFIDQTQGLGDKLGCLLVQLPPSLAFDARVATNFFGMLRRRWAGAVVCEPRHPSWFSDETAAFLQRHDIARAGADPAPAEGGGHPSGGASVRYWRLHGSPQMYYSAYDDPALSNVAAAVRDDLPTTDAHAWVIFDNTALGHAIANALRLKALMRVEG